MSEEAVNVSGGVELAPGVTAGTGAFRWQFARSAGPGGQNVNKVNTKAELWVDLRVVVGLSEGAKMRLVALAGRRITGSGELHISSDSHRSQSMNRAEVMERLRGLIVAVIYEPKRRKKVKPGRAAKRRRLEEKRRRGEVKAGRRGAGEE